MVSIRFASAFAAASMLLMAAADTTTSAVISNPIATPTVTLPASQTVQVGCFETGTPLENHGSYQFQSQGNCQLICLELGKNVMGLSDGENCWCGDEYPPMDSKTDNSSCSTTCAVDPAHSCGGAGLLWVLLTGNTRNQVNYYLPPSSSSSSSSSSTHSSTTTSMSTEATATSTGAPPPPPKNDGKPPTVAIAVGVVVGILALAALCFGVWFLLQRRRKRQAEEDYRRNAANVNAFVNGGKLHTSNSSMNDSRLDPSFMDRRLSNGSIADNEDYSRRILKVTNV